MSNTSRKIGLIGDAASNKNDDVESSEAFHPLSNTDLGPKEWAREYLQLRDITYHYKTDSFYLKGNILEETVLLSELRLGLYKYGLTHLKTYLPDAIRMIKREEYKKSLDRLKFDLTYKKYSSVNISQNLKSIGELNELDCIVFHHWLWLVKRKIFGLQTEHELMLVLYGRSGAGKSYFLRKLLEPLNMVTIYTDMRVFNDQFGLRQFTRNRVMVFDELDMVSEVSVEKLKNVITAQEITWRVVRSEAVMSGRQNCTFVATTNLPVRDQIKDSTSARRYWQIDTHSNLNWEFINSFDFTDLWKSVDENGSSPLLPCLEEVRDVQNSVILHRDDLDSWIEQYICSNEVSESPPTSSDLYSHFDKYCQINDVKNIYSKNKFCRQLHHKLKINGFDGEIKTHRYNGTVWHLSLKDVK